MLLYRRMEPLVTNDDWMAFGGLTPTFIHPALSHTELRFLPCSADTQFYARPSFLANDLRMTAPRMQRTVTC